MTEGEGMERGLTVAPQTAGTHALAALSDEAFEANLLAIRQGQQRIARMQKELLIPGVDYGNVPGVDKPSLGKPGAEKFCLAYGLAARIERVLVPGDNVTAPFITYDSTCYLHLGSFDGPIVGVGFGTCNSWETKYRWRNQERTCPACSNATIIAGKAEYGGGWLCFKKRGGCGAKFGTADPRITEQQVGREENPEPYDLANTIMKMSEKRSHVDATLRTTAASGIFTQDLEDNVVTVEATPAPARARSSNEPPAVSDADVTAMGGTFREMPTRCPSMPSAGGEQCAKEQGHTADHRNHGGEKWAEPVQDAPQPEEGTFVEVDATPEATGCGSVAADGLMIGAVCILDPHETGFHRNADGSWPR